MEVKRQNGKNQGRGRERRRGGFSKCHGAPEM